MRLPLHSSARVGAEGFDVARQGIGTSEVRAAVRTLPYHVPQMTLRDVLSEARWVHILSAASGAPDTRVTTAIVGHLHTVVLPQMASNAGRSRVLDDMPTGAPFAARGACCSRTRGVCRLSRVAECSRLRNRGVTRAVRESGCGVARSARSHRLVVVDRGGVAAVVRLRLVLFAAVCRWV